MFEALRAKLDTSLKAGQGETIYEVGVGAMQDEPGLAGVGSVTHVCVFVRVSLGAKILPFRPMSRRSTFRAIFSRWNLPSIGRIRGVHRHAAISRRRL